MAINCKRLRTLLSTSRTHTLDQPLEKIYVVPKYVICMNEDRELHFKPRHRI